MLDSKIQRIRDYYGIWTFNDWSQIEPDQLLKLPGIGRVTLDHVRLYLAGHGVTLRNDRTPDFWMEHARRARIVQQITEDEDEAVVCPFTILIDSNEQQPFAFVGIKSDADQQYKPIIVRTEWRSLGRHPNQLGDYSIDGFLGRCHVERKSIDDCQGTLLDFTTGGRERFEQELANLAAVESAMVVVEGTIPDVLAKQNDRRKREHRLVAKQLHRSILAMMQDHHVPWYFAGSRREAEISTFRFLERFWKKHGKKEKEAEAILTEL